MTMSDLELLLRITHSAVGHDIRERQAGRRHYMVRGLYYYSGGNRERRVTTLNGDLTIQDGEAANG